MRNTTCGLALTIIAALMMLFILSFRSPSEASASLHGSSDASATLLGSPMVVASADLPYASVDEIVRVRARNCTDAAGNTSVVFSPDLTPTELAGTAPAMAWWEGCTRGQRQLQTTARPAHYSPGQRVLLTGSLSTGATCTSEERDCKRSRHDELLHKSSSKGKPKHGTQAVPGAAAAMVVNTPPADMPSDATPSTPADGEAAAEAVPEVDMTQHALSSLV